MAPLYTDPARNTAQFLGNVIARGIAWAVIGAWVGAGDGLRQRSVPVIRNGVIGGLAGGFAGGVLFEIIPWLLPGLRTGAPSRLVGFSATGALIGLLTGLVRELFSEAWVKVSVGRNEFKDILLERLENTVGRHELCDIPLYGDPSVAKRHAILRRTSSGWEIAATGESSAPPSVDGEPVTAPRPLRTGNRIRIGTKELIFEERKVRTPTASVPREAARPAPVPPLPGQPVSPFPSQTASSPAAPHATRPIPQPTIGAPASAAFARLVAVGGPHAGTVFTVPSGGVIGRDPANTVALPADTKASRRHAVLGFHAGAWRIADQNSTNGTWVNGQRIAELALAPGDVVVIGETSLRYEG